jgi:hypothetical protein
MDFITGIWQTYLADDFFTRSIIAVIFIILVAAIVALVVHFRKTQADLNVVSGLAQKMQKNDKLLMNELGQAEQHWVSRTLVLDKKEHDLVAEKIDGRYLTRVPIYQCVPLEAVTQLKSIPALLTSIGVAGTFLGITLGLAGFDMSDVGQNSGGLIKSAVVLLDGMKTAFYTSLAGLTASVILMVGMQISAKRAGALRAKVNNSLLNQLNEMSAINYLQQIANSSVKNSDGETEQQNAIGLAIDSLNQNLGGHFSQLKSLSDSFNGDVMAEQISSAISKTMQESVAPVLVDFKDELATLRQIKEDNQQELLTTLVNTIKEELITPVTEELGRTTEALNASNDVSQKLNDNVANVLTEVGRTVETIDSFNKSTMQKLQEFAQNLSGVLTEFKNNTQGTMQTITEKVENVLAISIKGMEAQRTAFDESANKAALAFEGMGSKLEEALDKRAKSEGALFEDMESRIKTLLQHTSDSFERQTDVLEKTGLEASNLMESARIELEKGLGDIDTKVTGMANTIQKELESFRIQYQDNLTSFFDEQNNLLEGTLGKQRNNLLEVVDKFKQVFEEEYQTRHSLLKELTQQHDHLQKSAQTIQQLAKAIGLTETATMSELQDIAHTMGRHVGELKKEYIQASAAFKEVTEGLPKAMEQYFKEANQSTELFFQGFDEASSKIHNRLAQAADYLVDARIQDSSYEKEVAV